jgi:chemosensory pili system protein ChpA (sensor histidine kinase/response regulator)
MMPPFEHMLRNAVAHGIEAPELRKKNGKNESGTITISLHREGSEVVVEVSDDGAGMNLKAIRDKGISLGMVRADQQLSDEDIMQLVLEPGFSTAGAVSTLSGRGVGMDVVASEIKKLGGALHMETKQGEGSRFTCLTADAGHQPCDPPRANDELYARHYSRYRRRGAPVHARSSSSAETRRSGTVPEICFSTAFYVGRGVRCRTARRDRAGTRRAGDIHRPRHRRARGRNVWAWSPQISAIRGISGATILGDGRIVIILDIGALVPTAACASSRSCRARRPTRRHRWWLVHRPPRDASSLNATACAC